MAVRGWVQGCEWRPRGSELVADLVAGATVLTVEDPTDFDDEAGVVLLNDVQYTYSAGAVDDDAATITLDTGITAEAFESDPVYTVAGGQILQDCILSVSCGDGDDVEVTVPFAQRDLWPEGDYDEPVQVLLSDDLESIVDVPGRLPERFGDSVKYYYLTSTGPYFKLDTSASLVRGTNNYRADLDANPTGPAGKNVYIRMEPGKVPTALVQAMLTLFSEKITLDASGDGTLTSQGGLANGGGVRIKGGLDVNGGADITGDVNMFGMGTTSNSPNMFIGAGGLVRESTGSSERFKDNIVDLDLDLGLVRQIRTRAFTYQSWYYDNPDEVFWGLIGEELEALGLGKFVDYDEDGQVINVRYANLVIAVLALAQDNADRIDALEAEKAAQQEQIDALTARLDALEAGS